MNIYDSYVKKSTATNIKTSESDLRKEDKIMTFSNLLAKVKDSFIGRAAKFVVDKVVSFVKGPVMKYAAKMWGCIKSNPFKAVKTAVSVIAAISTGYIIGNRKVVKVSKVGDDETVMENLHRQRKENKKKKEEKKAKKQAKKAAAKAKAVVLENDLAENIKNNVDEDRATEQELKSSDLYNTIIPEDNAGYTAAKNIINMTAGAGKAHKKVKIDRV